MPDPCSPTTIITVGGLDDRLSLLSEPPIKAVISSWTILTICCPGVRLLNTSWPTARSLTRFTKSLTTLKFTSASNRARRISRMATFTSSSVILPFPRSLRKISWSLSVNPSNATVPLLYLNRVTHLAQYVHCFLDGVPVCLGIIQ